MHGGPENMEDNILNRIYGKPIDIHVREDHGATETLQKKLMHDDRTETVFHSEPEDMNHK